MKSYHQLKVPPVMWDRAEAVARRIRDASPVPEVYPAGFGAPDILRGVMERGLSRLEVDYPAPPPSEPPSEPGLGDTLVPAIERPAWTPSSGELIEAITGPTTTPALPADWTPPLPEVPLGPPSSGSSWARATTPPLPSPIPPLQADPPPPAAILPDTAVVEPSEEPLPPEPGDAPPEAANPLGWLLPGLPR